jgi:hypothetical protein
MVSRPRHGRSRGQELTLETEAVNPVPCTGGSSVMGSPSRKVASDSKTVYDLSNRMTLALELVVVPVHQ